ncbi:integrase, partial [Shewanella marisflavi]|uniref:integrase repeat-containing protein n=1 Tax=Shewanella marisflavi TaxID=260364 RepID=UPI0024B2262D
MKKFYSSLAEAQQAAQTLAIATLTEYQKRYRQDPRLPSQPNRIYAADWQSWPSFLGTEDKYYPTLDEAQQAAQTLAIATLTEYQKRYRQDPRLPSSPSRTYAADWQSWPSFLGTEDKYYPTLAEAQQAAQTLAIA